MVICKCIFFLWQYRFALAFAPLLLCYFMYGVCVCVWVYCVRSCYTFSHRQLFIPILMFINARTSRGKGKATTINVVYFQRINMDIKQIEKNATKEKKIMRVCENSAREYSNLSNNNWQQKPQNTKSLNVRYSAKSKISDKDLNI